MPMAPCLPVNPLLKKAFTVSVAALWRVGVGRGRQGARRINFDEECLKILEWMAQSSEKRIPLFGPML